MNLLSGDQKGNPAPSVPANGWACRESIGRIHSEVFPSGPDATYASCLPSGEIANPDGAPESVKLELGAGWIEERITCLLSGAWFQYRTPKTIAAAKEASASAIQYRSRLIIRVGTDADICACDTPSAIHRSSPGKSDAVCHRCSNSFARHRRITWSSAGGVIGLMELIGAGSFSRIADATLNWLLPSNAFLPVNIS